MDHPEELDVEDVTCGREEEGQDPDEDAKPQQKSSNI